MPHSEASDELVIEIRKLRTQFGDLVVHSSIDLDVRRQEIFALIGGSGSGKSTLLREMILLQRPSGGSIRVLGADLAELDEQQAKSLRLRFGVMFQHGGLFSALTVLENIGLPMREHTDRSDADIDQRAAEKLALVGLKPEVGAQYPSELSGGMMKRASMARALALDPELLFLDEPTAGLDPHSAGGVDELVRQLRDESGLTIVMITHDLDLLWQVADRVAVLAEGKVQAAAPMAELSQLDIPVIHQFFGGHRGRTAQAQHGAAAPAADAHREPEPEPQGAAS